MRFPCPILVSSVVTATLLPAMLAATLAAAETTSALPTRAQVTELITKAQDWLLTQQHEDGAFIATGAKLSLGITELATAAIAQAPGLPAQDPHLVKAVAFIRACRRPDGGIYVPEEGLASYGTSMGLLALIAAGAADPQTTSAAQSFLLANQVDKPGSASDGGIGYATPRTAGHADLSNTHLALAALRASGLPATDAHLQHALRFLEHCQQLSAVNSLPWVDMSPAEAGGAVYNPDPQGHVAPGTPAGTPPSAPAKPTCYGSMTYALLSGYRDLDVATDDQRVAAALAWISAHYSTTINPGRAEGKQSDGMYYYYWVMSKALTDLHATTLTLSDGRVIDWRSDLYACLSARAKNIADLSPGQTGTYWIGQTRTWSEYNPVLVTAYVIQTLKRIYADLPAQ